MIPRPQTPPEATINPTGGAGAANASTFPLMGDCASRTVATHERSPFGSPPFGWVSTIAEPFGVLAFLAAVVLGAVLA